MPNELAKGLFHTIPESLRLELLTAYEEITRNYREERWEPAELNGGKLCEVVFSILRGHADGAFPAAASKPANMVDACKALEKIDQSFPRSVRIQIPRMLVALYEVRNNRGVGHVGGDVNPNHMDATCVLQMSKWVMSELVRLFHAVSTEEATKAIDALVDRTIPVIWKVGGKVRVLKPNASMKDKMMMILYHAGSVVSEADLFAWVEHSNSSAFRRDVIRKSHKAKLLEYNPTLATIEISPLGIQYVEENLLSPN
jgi:hypothetical protein